MKKIEYKAPEMEEVNIKVLTSLLTVSDDEPGNGGNGDQFEE